MKPSDELAELIRSMSPSEKRYFKLQASTFKDDSHYLLLFDAIDRKVAEDDASMRDFLGKHHVTVPLSRLKNYLHQLIMKTLREYHLDHYPEFKIVEALRDFRIQKDRKLDRQASKSLQRAIKLAKQYDRSAYFWEASRHLMGEDIFEPDPAKYLQLAENVLDEQQKAVDDMQLTIECHRLSVAAISLQKEHIKTNDPEKLKRMRVLIDRANELLQRPLPGYCQMYLYTVLNLCYAQTNQYDKSLENNTHLITLTKERPVQLGVSDEEIFFAYTNQMYHLIYRNKTEEFKELAATIRQDPSQFFISRSEFYPAALLFSAYAFEVSQAILSGNFEEGLQYVKPAEEVIAKYPDAGSAEFLFSWYYRLMILHFGLGRYGEALDVINLILEGKIIRYGADFGSYIRMVNIIVHYELANHKLLPSAMKATEQFIRSRGQMGPVDKLLLDMLKKFIKAPNNGAANQVCQEYALKIREAVDSNPSARTPLIYFDFLTWMDGKADGLLFGEALRRSKQAAKQPA